MSELTRRSFIRSVAAITALAAFPIHKLWPRRPRPRTAMAWIRHKASTMNENGTVIHIPVGRWVHLGQTQTRWGVKCYIDGQCVSKRNFARRQRNFNMFVKDYPLFV